MLTMQHVLHAVLLAGNDITPEYLGGTIFPDAIRAYSVPRQLSHFERSDNRRSSSWWTMPTEMSSLTPELVKSSIAAGSHLVWNAPAPFGRETDVPAFLEHNPLMRYNREMYAGVLSHLSAQDMAFDSFVRWKILNLKDMRKDRIYLQPKIKEECRIPSCVQTSCENGRIVLDGKEARRLITEIEIFGVYVLAHQVYERWSIVCDQEWFDTCVSSLLYQAYPQDLADKSLKYMREDPDISEWIHAKDFSHLEEAPIPLELYERLYKAAEWGTEQVWKTGEPGFMFW